MLYLQSKVIAQPFGPLKRAALHRPLRQRYRDAGKKGERQRRIERIVKKSGEIDERGQMMLESEGEWRTGERWKRFQRQERVR